MSSKSIPKGLFILLVIALLFVPVISSFAETINYTYDDLNRLKRIEYENGTVVMYGYDEVGNRIEMGPVFLGDINNDGIIDILDVILEVRMALKIDPIKPCSDLNNDGIVDISDVILTLRMALKIDPLQQCT